MDMEIKAADFLHSPNSGEAFETIEAGDKKEARRESGHPLTFFNAGAGKENVETTIETEIFTCINTVLYGTYVLCHGGVNMARHDTYIDWNGCDLVEHIPGKVSGRAIVRGTRILADTIVQDSEMGSSLEEIHENYPDLSITAIQAMINFAQMHHIS
jgi:uncharacterized protein (DUF433 family)